MNETQANIVQHKVMIMTIRILFRNAVLFFICKLQFRNKKTGEWIQFRLYSLNTIFALILRSL
jgi:hypothetical protein